MIRCNQSPGIVSTANIVPMIAFTLFGGALADRLGCRLVMLTADLVRCAAQAVLAVALTIGRPSLWLFVAAAFVVGTGNAFFSPALSGFPVQLVLSSRLGDANALLGSAQPAAQVAGPALAGILIAVTSPALVIAVDAGSYALSARPLALALHLPLPAAPRHVVGPSRRTWRAASIWPCVPPGQNIRALWHPGALLVALWPPGSIHFGLVAPKARFVSALQYPGRVLVLAPGHLRPLPVPALV